MTDHRPADEIAPKTALRTRLLQSRRERDDASGEAVAEAVAAHLLALPSVVRARRVAGYRSMRGEPGTEPLLAGLVARGVEVVVPVSLPDGTLDWVVHDPADATVRSALGVEEPLGERLGAAALATADVVVLPALAADHAGRRLGRGAGYYDRALASALSESASSGAGASSLAPRRPLLVAVVHADELLPEVPHEPHDVPVDMVVTESGVFRVP